MAPKRAKASSGPLGPLQKESLQVSASSGEMGVRPQNCTGTNSSLNLVLIPTWVLTERPEECNPAHPVSPLECPEPKECGRGTTPFQDFGTLSSVTMRLLQVVLAAVFIIFQVLPAATRAFNFERPCYLRGGICLKQGTPDCEPFRGPCRAFTVCCKVKGLWGRAAAEKP
ncbi:uncharacterized protein LOC132691480 [Panthera onca]|uniref:uncharacterized protein LOC132691480 isoform X4 n=1 Tax=Panthera onca TaxID=9690 RepID=UPI002954F1F7|nr:uncharacterized protein LOC132691480 isoform X4 [Panthera onca]